MINYTVLDSQWMWYEGKRDAMEIRCDGCGMPFPKCEKLVAVITDRSGSEYGVAHIDYEDHGDELRTAETQDCVLKAVWTLDEPKEKV